ncbi:hypothetical protein IVB01_00225 [Bradyrhizobium sp. 164]|nr:hypothetical protein [Bradyrhizobium sp. 164]MCK1593338.1 hypothetical protein [Bradyrhizobium sp. 164]
MIASFRARFADMEQRREPSPADLQTAVWSHYETGLDHDGRSRAALPTVAALREVTDKLATDIEAGRVLWSSDPMVQLNATIDLIVMRDAAKLDRERRAIQLAELRKHLATGETALIEWKADEVIQSERLLVVKARRPTAIYASDCSAHKSRFWSVPPNAMPATGPVCPLIRSSCPPISLRANGLPHRAKR